MDNAKEGAMEEEQPDFRASLAPSSEGALVRNSLNRFLSDDVLNKVAWLFLILPGFLSYAATSLIVPGETRSEFEVLAFSLAYLLINLAIVLSTFALVAMISRRRWPQDKKKTVGVASGFVVTLFGTSLVTGIAGGVVLERDLFFKFAKAIPLLPIPIQDSIHSPLDRILRHANTGLNHEDNPPPDNRPEPDRPTDSNQAFARITLANGETYEGFPLYFDFRRSMEQIYLSPACLLAKSAASTKVMPIGGPGVVLFERDIRSIILLDFKTTICYTYWYTSEKNRSEISELDGLAVYGRELLKVPK